MNVNPLVAFVQTHVEMLIGSLRSSVSLPLPEKLARRFLGGFEAQLLGYNDLVIRARAEEVLPLQQWIRQYGLEEWFNIDRNVFRINEKALQPEDKTQIVNALARLFPPQLHVYPGKVMLFFMRIRRLFDRSSPKVRR